MKQKIFYLLFFILVCFFSNSTFIKNPAKTSPIYNKPMPKNTSLFASVKNHKFNYYQNLPVLNNNSDISINGYKPSFIKPLKLEKLKKEKEEKEKEKLKKEKEKEENKVVLTLDERNLLERLVEAEAGDEPYEGKLAVATVVINRMQYSEWCPDTIHGVIYQKNQFSPVNNGTIHNTPSEESIKAVSEVIDEGYRSFGPEILFFLNPKIATDKWIIDNKTFVSIIGQHHFYK